MLRCTRAISQTAAPETRARDVCAPIGPSFVPKTAAPYDTSTRSPLRFAQSSQRTSYHGSRGALAIGRVVATSLVCENVPPSRAAPTLRLPRACAARARPGVPVAALRRWRFWCRSHVASESNPLTSARLARAHRTISRQPPRRRRRCRPTRAMTTRHARGLRTRARCMHCAGWQHSACCLRPLIRPC